MRASDSNFIPRLNFRNKSVSYSEPPLGMSITYNTDWSINISNMYCIPLPLPQLPCLLRRHSMGIKRPVHKIYRICHENPRTKTSQRVIRLPATLLVLKFNKPKKNHLIFELFYLNNFNLIFSPKFSALIKCVPPVFHCLNSVQEHKAVLTSKWSRLGHMPPISPVVT